MTDHEKLEYNISELSHNGNRKVFQLQMVVTSGSHWQAISYNVRSSRSDLHIPLSTGIIPVKHDKYLMILA